MPNNILLGVGAALAGAVLAIIIWLSLSNAHLKSQLAAAQASMTACQIMNDEFKTAANKQSDAIESMQNESLIRARHVAEAQKATQHIASHFAKRAQIYQQHKADGDDCHAAEALMNDYIAH